MRNRQWKKDGKDRETAEAERIYDTPSTSRLYGRIRQCLIKYNNARIGITVHRSFQ